MDQRNTNKEVGQMDKVHHRLHGRQNNHRPQGHQMRDNWVGFSDNEPTVA
jgi:hypothetical protein